MKINILKYILVLVPEVPRGRPPKVQRACGLYIINATTRHTDTRAEVVISCSRMHIIIWTLSFIAEVGSVTTDLAVTENSSFNVTINGSTNITSSENLILTCTPSSVKDTMEFVWMFVPYGHRRPRDESSSRNIRQANRQISMTYTKENVSELDSGNYTCRITSNTGTTETSITVSIYTPDVTNNTRSTVGRQERPPTSNTPALGTLIGVLLFLITMITIGVAYLARRKYEDTSIGE